jgi:hypothetical protein
MDGMSELISGKEALIALSNGEEVEFKDGTNKWENIQHHLNLDLSMFLTAPDWMTFRLKPRTITINGIEVAAPFEPKKDDKYFFIDTVNSNVGYSSDYYEDKNEHACQTQFGAWRTEEEIKQVVAALRSIFNEKTKEGDPS